MRLTHLVPALLLASSLNLFAQHTHLATPSTWTLNTTESKFGGGPATKSEHFVMFVDTDKWAKYTDVMVDSDGKTWKSSWSAPADNKPHPITGMPGSTFQTDPATDVSIYKMPGEVTLTCHFSLSPDKKKFLQKCVAETAKGQKWDQYLVYDRTK
ncbi:MAG: hypothetical protein V4555_20120 [Acidobacteriota bacterium]